MREKIKKNIWHSPPDLIENKIFLNGRNRSTVGSMRDIKQIMVHTTPLCSKWFTIELLNQVCERAARIRNRDTKATTSRQLNIAPPKAALLPEKYACICKMLLVPVISESIMLKIISPADRWTISASSGLDKEFLVLNTNAPRRNAKTVSVGNTTKIESDNTSESSEGAVGNC